MIAERVIDAAKERALEILVYRGYEPVQLVENSFLSRYIALHLLGMRGDYEALAIKCREAYGAVSVSSVESLCKFEICQFRSLLTMSPGTVFIRCEIWVLSPNGSIHCFEVLPAEISEVAIYVS